MSPGQTYIWGNNDVFFKKSTEVQSIFFYQRKPNSNFTWIHSCCRKQTLTAWLQVRVSWTMLILKNYCIFFHSRMPLWVRKGKQNLLLLQNSVGCNFYKSLNLRKLKLANTIVYGAKQTKAYPIYYRFDVSCKRRDQTSSCRRGSSIYNWWYRLGPHSWVSPVSISYYCTSVGESLHQNWKYGFSFLAMIIHLPFFTI